jgi:hypothetical protein
VPYASGSGVRLALGRLPVTVAQVGGPQRPPAQPAAQPFWVGASLAGTLDWSPGTVRGQQLALVVMRPDAGATLHASIAAAVRPGWLPLLTWGSIASGVAGLAAGLVLLLWPVPRREIVYVVEPGQVGPLAARLGLRPPALATPVTGQPAALELAAPPVAALPPAPQAATDPGWMMATGEIVDVTAEPVAPAAPITPDFEWPPLAPAARSPQAG